RDDTRTGFTDHDRDLAFDGTTFEAASGFTATEITESLGLSVDNLDIEGAVSSDALDGDDLAAGLYDDAKIEIYRVNWQAPDQRALMRVGSIGEVKQSGHAFTAEVRGLAHYLQQPQGRIFQFGCDADLGDARCGVDLSSAAFCGEDLVASVISRRRYAMADLSAFAAGWFTGGTAQFMDGANAGTAIEIKSHEFDADGAAVVELWTDPVRDVAQGARLKLTAGCDKHFPTCRAKFANAANYRGFPFMPGNDAIARIASRRG
ncbi:MAG: DUF2163 domain-containing protein, partial [Pseudomonadota bacterium]